jgi:hypothetical protein
LDAGRLQQRIVFMAHRRALPFLLTYALLCSGCSSYATSSKPRRQGPKINFSDFIYHTSAYKEKSINLNLKVDQPSTANQSLRDYLGQEVQFSASGSRGEQLKLVILIPASLSVPDIGQSDEVNVTFVCRLGSLRQGNEATSIGIP